MEKQKEQGGKNGNQLKHLNSDKNCFQCFREYGEDDKKHMCYFCAEHHCNECMIGSLREMAAVIAKIRGENNNFDI